MYKLAVSPRAVALVLSIIVISLLIADLITQYITYFHGFSRLGLVRLFDLVATRAPAIRPKS
jgi:preprotein translocase subunit Sec61beta